MTGIDPLAWAMVAGAAIGVGVVVATVLRMGGAARGDAGYSERVEPDRRARRLDERVAASPGLRRAVAVTADLAARRGLLGSVERLLRAADLPARPAEVILGCLAGIVLVPMAVYAATGSAPQLVVSAVVMILGPRLALRFAVGRRRKRFAVQLPDALTTLAGALRAGRSLGQAMEGLSRDLADPMGRELRKVVAEVRLGRTMGDSLADATLRIESEDFRWAVLAMQIQAEVGGNLAELLDQVAETVRERSRMKGEVKALTAEGRASALLLVIMVPALTLVMWTLNSSYMEPLFSTPTGRILLGVSTVMITGGYLWMNKMVKIDV